MDGELIDFINNPDTVDFIVRNTEYYRAYIESKPEIKLTQVIGGRYIIGYAPSYFITTLVRELGTGIVSGKPLVLGLLGRANLDAAGIIQVQQQPFLDLKGRGVLIGIVDTGIDYTNRAFRYEDGSSKIQYLYDQTIIGNPPSGFFFGTEYTKEQIDIALNSPNPYDIVPSRDTVGHGTFLASVACGREDPDNPGYRRRARLGADCRKAEIGEKLLERAVPDTALSGKRVRIHRDYDRHRIYSAKSAAAEPSGVDLPCARHEHRRARWVYFVRGVPDLRFDSKRRVSEHGRGQRKRSKTPYAGSDTGNRRHLQY